METVAKPAPISLLFDELIVCGAVLSGFELCEALRELGQEAYIVSQHNNKELEDYFNIKPIPKPKGTTITFTPKLSGDYAYIRTKDERWLNHKEPKIAVSKWIADWIPSDTIIGNGTHKRFKNLVIEKDIDILIEGNYEENKQIHQTIEKAKQLTDGKILWFGRSTVPWEGVETISNPSLEEIVQLYNRSRIFLKMSKEEGWNRPVAEATKCGCDVINLSGGNQDIKIIEWQDIANQLIQYLNGKG